MDNHFITPLFTRMVSHSEHIDVASLHVPGHKNGMAFPTQSRKWFDNILKLDLTELTGLDDLHDPEEVIKEAQDLTAAFYGAEQSFFLVGGTTVGNLAMILAACRSGDKVFVQRDSHKSVMSGLKLADVTPVFLTPDYNKELGLTTGVSYETILSALKEHPDVKALILTNPTYYGVATPLKDIISLAHTYKVPVLVDEAHGAHFGIGGPFPASALSQGADIVVQSAHKTLPAMTMASFLHFNSEIISKERVRMYLQTLQSSSPSYPLMASLDIARSYIATLTDNKKKEIHEAIEKFQQGLKQIPQIKVIESEEVIIDPLKITVKSNCDATGYELQSLLESVGIYSELADDTKVLFVLPLAPFESERLLTKVKESLVHLKPLTNNMKDSFFTKDNSRIGMLVIPYSKMDEYSTKKIQLDDACGEIIAEHVVTYPPGIPVLMAGEEIREVHIEDIKYMASRGARFQGHSQILTKGIIVFDV
ncbi:aminotransferase class I/II-fold pyridoxal phosphate-dependent enzyme [Bacillus sp. FJAT-45350]|uniref:aminotransferase class I/II-fold pyridoxal phosphate-dependent enzyme n=1 Tax=Bacillus sp. FJAT-45350 TaxID=2011014 RepID=UPI000BB76ECA|nr:aminotransferase class I/II-fold pyridoxal phosphate-dependent enzyme [Bacillus sp. FJAT-45350]